MTPQSFDRLLVCLDENRERAASRYEELRGGLVMFFTFRSAADPHSLTDEVFDRAARRLDEGSEIYADNLASYFYAIARNLWREVVARPYSIEPLPEQLPARAANVFHTVSPEQLLSEIEAQFDSEKRLDCLSHCLEKLSAQERDLIVSYYSGEGGTKIANRLALADGLGVEQSALRKRASRLRTRLASCISGCVSDV